MKRGSREPVARTVRLTPEIAEEEIRDDRLAHVEPRRSDERRRLVPSIATRCADFEMQDLLLPHQTWNVGVHRAKRVEHGWMRDPRIKDAIGGGIEHRVV